MHRRSFLFGLFAGCAVTVVAALVARSIETPSAPPSAPKQMVLLSPNNAPQDEAAPDPKLPPGSMEQYFNGVPYYIVPLEPAAQ